MRRRPVIIGLSVLATILGVVGLPEKVQALWEILRVMEHEWVRWLFLAVGMSGLVYAYLYDLPYAREKEWRHPWRSRRLWAARRAALQNSGGGIYIAKLIGGTRTKEEAEEILDIYNDAADRTNEGSVYASYAHALVRFGHLLVAGGALIAADRDESIENKELDAGMDRLFYPQDDGNPVHRNAPRSTKIERDTDYTDEDRELWEHELRHEIYAAQAMLRIGSYARVNWKWINWKAETLGIDRERVHRIVNAAQAGFDWDSAVSDYGAQWYVATGGRGSY